ncbi:MAG TPA: 3-isopropylmalate dehydratase small subunit [Thermodesulfobacteriota bacterium]|nr:3-isopropylmalate dehydratase small subunit [Thermodesulfobacteriota bacterium]
MEPLVKITGVVAPLDRMNVDTDQIIPKQFLKRIERTGFGEFLFFDWRYLEDGSLNSDFELNQPHLAGASILLAGQNFGSGSSREHAPWALREYGFRVIIAPSFADIFYNNCFKNSILPIALPEADVKKLFEKTAAKRGYSLTVDLPTQTISDGEGLSIGFDIDPFKKKTLLEGLDDISLTLRSEDSIEKYEEKMARERAWAIPSQPH